MGKRYKNIKLVSNQAGVAKNQDPQLINAWGIITDNGTLWVASTDGNSVQHYNKKGELLGSVLVKTGDIFDNPTGLVLNKSKGFVISGPGGLASAEWITVTEGGRIFAFNHLVDANNAILVSDDSGEGAVYKGVAQFGNVIYVANFSEGSIDTYDYNWNEVSGFNFIDPNLPEDYVPFNVAVICGKVYVAYALKEESGDEEETGPGLGLISVFDTDGNFIRRLINPGGRLNAPWGMDKAPKCFGKFSGKFLVGNFGDGAINVYDFDGNFLGFLKDCQGDQIKIDGLWGIVSKCDKVYYAAGPDEEENGLVGFIKVDKC